MDAADKRMLEREALRNMIQQWNANRLDLFELSEPNENLEFHGVMRFYFQDSGQKIATKCIRVASDATVSDVIETLIEKFRPDMRMLSLGSYSLWETHGPDDERRLEPHEKPLLVQLNWHADDREGRFLLKCTNNDENSVSNSVSETSDQNFKRKLSKREKKELKKKEKLSRLKSDTNEKGPVAEKLYKELPETSFTRSISNPEAVMRRRRQLKLERKLQQFRSKDGGPDTGGTLKIYGSSLCSDVPYKTLLLSVGDTAAGVVKEMLDKYGLSRHQPSHYCIVQVDTTDNSEYILEDDDCPLAIVMTHPHHSSIMFHVRRRPAESQPRRRKKKVGAGPGSARPGFEPALLEVSPDGTPLDNGRRVRITDAIEVGSGNGSSLQLFGPSIQPRHCVVTAGADGTYSVTPLHADAQVYLNGQRVAHTQRLQHGSLLRFGRVSTYRFVDPTQETLMNRNLSQSQNFGSGSIYDSRSVGRETLSPTSALEADTDDRPTSPDADFAHNNNSIKLDETNEDNELRNNHFKDNYETTFDLDGNVETKSICSAKSGGSGHDSRIGGYADGGAGRPGQEAILPAVLEFPDAGQAHFLAAVISRLDPHAPAFKLAPVYTLYLCARYRASTHYRPELSPTERAHKLTAFLHHVATLIHATVQERCNDSAAQAFWMANASELLHFLKCDRHISSFSTQAQELLPTTVQNAFSNLVSCFQDELSGALVTLCTRGNCDATEATAPTLQALAAAMVLLRRCRVNAALTIQLFSHLFHYINAVCFNKLVTEPGLVEAGWGASLSARLALLGAWAERQGLELAADCHLARSHQAARLIQGTYNTPEEVRAALSSCFKLNSVQVRALLSPLCAPDVLEAAVHHTRTLADELYRADGREITLCESWGLGAGLLTPGDGFSLEVVRGVPPGLAEFVAPLQRGGLCRLAHQPHANGLWTVYMHGYGAAQQQRRPTEPRVQIIQLHKNTNGMGLSIVAARGAGQSKLGIYIKSVVGGGAAAQDGRLSAGDQLLSVDGHSLQGITQEKAAEYLVRTGPTVTLEVAKQGAVLHGLATLLHQPAINQRPELTEVQYEDRSRRNSGTFTNPHPAMLRASSPLHELVTTGNRRRSCNGRCHLREESSESSSDESEQYRPQYHGSIPRLIITLDHENNQLNEDFSPTTPGCPVELQSHPKPIPVFMFTCEDFDEIQRMTNQNQQSIPDQSSDNGEPIDLPPKMEPIDTKLTLDLFGAHAEQYYRARCTGIDECVSACECCRAPHPDAPIIPYIDEVDSEPLIFETRDRVPTPKVRRILPSLSLDRTDDKVDAECQTVTPLQRRKVPIQEKRQEKPLNDPKADGRSRLKRALFTMSRSISSNTDETDIPSTYSTSETLTSSSKNNSKDVPYALIEGKTTEVLDTTHKKSWKSPDEFRPSYGKVKELTKHFDNLNLSYCVKTYKRHCKSSPNLSARETEFKPFKSIQNSTSLADIQFASKTEDCNEKRNKLSEDEVKSILIQLEDWSKYGSRGSGDTLAQGNEFELPNLPIEEHDNNNSITFNEIVDKKPKTITLDVIRIEPDHLNENESVINEEEVKLPRVVSMIPQNNSLSTVNMSDERSRLFPILATSCPDISRFGDKQLSRVGGRRASERDLRAEGGGGEGVKSSKSTPALHHAVSPTGPHSISAAPSAVRSRSSHNLAQDTFYQNLALHPPQDRWSSLRSSNHSTRPQSAHFNAANPPEPQPDSPLHGSHSGSNMSIRAAKLAEMSEEVTRRQQQQQQLQQQYGHKLPSPLSPHLSHLHGSQHLQQPHSVQNYPQHMQSPSQYMQTPPQQVQNTSHVQSPSHIQNTSHIQGPPQHLQSTPQHLQSPHQHLQSTPQHLQSPHQHLQSTPQHLQSPHQHLQSTPQHLQSTPQHMQSPSHIQNPQHHLQNPSHLQNQVHNNQHIQSPPQHIQSPAQHLQSPPPHMQSPLPNHMQSPQHYHNQQPQPQRYEWHPPGPPSPQRSQPPVAPKPQGLRRPEMELDDQQQINNIMPQEDEWRNESVSPWQREERERDADRRRAALAVRRDATISHLMSLGNSRTAAQNQQLRALQLERDFEQRANQNDAEELGDVPSEEGPLSPLPPKSILKSRPDPPNGHVHEHTTVETASSALSALALAPPPPQRGSSFSVMAARGDTANTPGTANTVNIANTATAQHNGVVYNSGSRDKRVSFHERAASLDSGAAPPPPVSTPPPLEDVHTPTTTTFEQMEHMLASPESPLVAGSTHTPGVIGAQEVYRDPRAKRLAEQQAKSTSAPIPEHLSFKEKMKMFALESGEASTPKDKVKISRAQRDIDAVH